MLLSAHKDFTFETVLSTDRNLELLRQAKEQGYEIYAVFVLTNSPYINIQRVKSCAKAGGHDVPEEKVLSWYDKSLRNLSQLVRIADHARVIDNSGDKPHMICEISNQQLVIWETENWSKKDILRLFSDKRD